MQTCLFPARVNLQCVSCSAHTEACVSLELSPTRFLSQFSKHRLQFYLNRSAMYRKNGTKIPKNLRKLNPPPFRTKRAQEDPGDSCRGSLTAEKQHFAVDTVKCSHCLLERGLLPLSATALGQPSLPTPFLQNQSFLHARLVMDKPLTQLPCALHKCK